MPFLTAWEGILRGTSSCVCKRFCVSQQCLCNSWIVHHLFVLSHVEQVICHFPLHCIDYAKMQDAAGLDRHSSICLNFKVSHGESNKGMKLPRMTRTMTHTKALLPAVGNMRCVGVRGDAWSVMLSPCNTHTKARTDHELPLLNRP